MTRTEIAQLKLLRVSGSSVYALYKGVVYFLSFLGPVLFIHHFRFLPVIALLAFAIVGYGFAGCVFLLLLVMTKKLFIGPIHASGSYTIHANEGKKWFLAAMLTVIHHDGPFQPMTGGMSLFAVWYYRGMGAKMPDSALLGMRALIFDPWFIEVGENVSIGSDAMILGHIGQGKEFILGKVVIGDEVLIGVRAVIFPDVHIGNRARVAAGALVPRGTVIPEGETWGGIPARRIAPKPSSQT